MPRRSAREPLRVSYARSSVGRAGAPVQEWRSELTGRIFEVLEANSYEPTADLEPGAAGYLRFQGGVPYVTRRPEDRFEPVRAGVAGRTGTGRSAPAWSEAGRSGTERSGAGRSGAAESGPSRSGTAARRGAVRGGAALRRGPAPGAARPRSPRGSPSGTGVSPSGWALLGLLLLVVLWRLLVGS